MRDRERKKKIRKTERRREKGKKRRREEERGKKGREGEGRAAAVWKPHSDSMVQQRFSIPKLCSKNQKTCNK